MTAPSVAQILTSAPATALPGTWKLVRGRAVTLRPATDGILRVAHGRVWATLDGPHGSTPFDGGDHVLEVGRSMYARAGQRIVIEAWNASGPSYFAWDPVLAPVMATSARPRPNPGIVLQPLADLRLALGLALGALGRLGTGLAHLGWAALGGGGRALPVRRPPGLVG